MKYFILIVFVLVHCKEGGLNKDKLKFIKHKKNSIVLIDINYEKHKKEMGSNDFRNYLLLIKKRIDQFEPLLVYFGFNFHDNTPEIEQFSMKINKVNKIISTINSLENDEIDESELAVKQYFGTIIKADKLISSRNYFLSVDHLSFPSPEIAKRSKAVCFHGITTEEDKIITGLIPYYQYKDFLFENCAITVVNEALSDQNLEIRFDFKNGTPALYQKNVKVAIKQIDTENKRSLKIPVSFSRDQFQLLDADQFIQSDTSFNPGLIYIVVTSTYKLYSLNGDSLPSGPIIASEVYSLLDLISSE